MKKLFDQIIKFGLVGVLCFLIDWLTGLVVLNIVGNFIDRSIATQVAAVSGFTVSVIVNYLLSMKFVFTRKEDLNRKAEFIIFMVLSIIGLGINSLVIWVCTGPIYNNIAALNTMNYSLVYTGAKVVATAIVMVYNFISRKIFLDKN